MLETLPHNPITSAATLFGHDPTECLVAVEPDREEGVWLYFREKDGVRRARAPYKPWILLTEPPTIPLPGAQLTELEGEGYRILAEFTNQAAYQEARFRVRDEHIEHLTYPGGAKMVLIRSGQTLFKGMTFQDITRFQFDIETDGLTPEPENNRILLIAVADNRGLLELLEGDEEEILERFAACIRQRDPDVIEGHNVFGFDFPFVLERARRHGVRLTLGRDGSEPRAGQERNYAIGGISRPFTPLYIHGRHILDTYLIVQRFDWSRGALTSYNLKECARVFGFAERDRVELPQAEIARLYREDPERVRTYALHDVIETGRLAELITPVEFYQTQMVPDNYGQVAVSGNGEKINALFIRAYLAAGKAVARTSPARAYAGGFSEVRLTGVLDRVVKADVESLYPSLMLTHKIGPASDTLGIFLPGLRDLTQRRLEAKRKAAESLGKGNGEQPALDFHYWDGLQASFKVLINSFYGYLGGPFNWNDYDAAEKVTEMGRELVQDVANRMEATGSKIIEIDTDGVYFVPPEDVQGEEAERAYIASIGAALPEGIRLAFDGRYATMLSVKTKNYVLVTYDGRKIFKGASLRSRADERYGRRFLAQAVDCLLKHDFDGLAALYADTIDALMQRRIPIDDLARRERVTEKTFQSEQKRRAAAVAAGVSVGEYVLVYERANGELGRLEEYAGDENTKYYMDKLYKFARRLEDAFGGAFDHYIPKPTAQGLPKQLQTTLDLF
ncbi:MAG TPA: 3'-5' exonuclease [Chthonomonadaceae bacterium]|nr:3'-5' exonuclease [Chthonomonadaceae bacterium]